MVNLEVALHICVLHHTSKLLKASGAKPLYCTLHSADYAILIRMSCYMNMHCGCDCYAGSDVPHGPSNAASMEEALDPFCHIP